MNLSKQSQKKQPKCRILVTGGPTRAYLDDVRYLSNYSSGELAYVLCQELQRRGFEVVLIAGPTCQPFEKLKLKKLVLVETAQQMLDQTMKLSKQFKPQFAVFTAAVLDFVPDKVHSGKVTSQSDWKVSLKPFPKIIDEVGAQFPSIRRVGFKLETQKENPKHQAEAFRSKRGLEALCLNFLDEVKKGHAAYLSFANGSFKRVKGKAQIAREIAQFISKH